MSLQNRAAELRWWDSCSHWLRNSSSLLSSHRFMSFSSCLCTSLKWIHKTLGWERNVHSSWSIFIWHRWVLSEIALPEQNLRQFACLQIFMWLTSYAIVPLPLEFTLHSIWLQLKHLLGQGPGVLESHSLHSLSTSPTQEHSRIPQTSKTLPPVRVTLIIR